MPSPTADALPGLNIGLSATFPGETVLVAVINLINTHRAGMNQENKDRADKMLLDLVEPGLRAYLDWVTAVVLPPAVKP